MRNLWGTITRHWTGIRYNLLHNFLWLIIFKKLCHIVVKGILVGLTFCRYGYFSQTYLFLAISDSIHTLHNHCLYYDILIKTWHINKDTVWLSSNRRNFMKMLNIQSSLNCSSCVKPSGKKPVKELVRLPQHLTPLLLPLTETCPSSRSYSRKKKQPLTLENQPDTTATVFLEAVWVFMFLSCWTWRISQNKKVTLQPWSCVTKQDCLIVLSKQRKNKVSKPTPKYLIASSPS